MVPFNSTPNEWGFISETVSDLPREILNFEEWDPQTTRAPIQNKFPPRFSLPDLIPFATARSTILDIPQKNKSQYNVYIN